jgi:hypothetical protein
LVFWLQPNLDKIIQYLKKRQIWRQERQIWRLGLVITGFFEIENGGI